jgi:small subunit ribosomal protein S8
MSINSTGIALTTLSQAYQLGHRIAVIPSTKLNRRITKLLFRQQQLEYYEEFFAGVERLIVLALLPEEQRLTKHYTFQQISKPGCRVYVKASECKKMLKRFGGTGLLIISTSKGLLTEQEALKQNVGGELLCHI